jgi:glycosyltransferase involved in cell wall biosynthesis
VLEGLPNTMLEALCTGLPVVVNSELELVDYINPGANGFEVRPDPVEFSSAANKVVHLGISIESRYKRAGNVSLSFDAKIIDDEFVKRIDCLINKKQSGV